VERSGCGLQSWMRVIAQGRQRLCTPSLVHSGNTGIKRPLPGDVILCQEAGKQSRNSDVHHDKPHQLPITSQLPFAINRLSHGVYSIEGFSYQPIAMGKQQKHVHARGNLEGDAFMLLFPTTQFTKALSHPSFDSFLSVRSIRTQLLTCRPRPPGMNFSCISLYPSEHSESANTSLQSACL
jgi:hypothetical protein